MQEVSRSGITAELQLSALISDLSRQFERSNADHAASTALGGLQGDAGVHASARDVAVDRIAAPVLERWRRAVDH